MVRDAMKDEGRLSTADLGNDPRWQLVERIASSSSFQKSTRLRDLLLFIAERTIHGHLHELTEQQIGHAVFGKPADYAPVEDSSVRVHVRQLRLKLHEYFDCEGKNEQLVLEIPKGSYVPLFRGVKPAVTPASSEPPALVEHSSKSRILAIAPWVLCLALAVACLFLRANANGLRNRGSMGEEPDWPFSTVLDSRHRTQIVVADSNYGMLRIIGKKPGSLDEYLKPDFQNSFKPPRVSEFDARLLSYIYNSTLTSYADVAILTSLISIAGSGEKNLGVRFARDLRVRDLDEGNYIFIGSPGSNPWVALFDSRLNFVESEGVVGVDMKFFRNKQPQPGEKESYQGLRFTGTAGEDYATISLLPSDKGRGNVLIFQGLQQEGTEAAGLFLTDETNRRKLREALGVHAAGKEPKYFEVLLRTRAVAGAPNSTNIVATRIFK